MRVAEPRLMFEHDRWAMARILAAAEALSAERFTAQSGRSSSSAA